MRFSAMDLTDEQVLAGGRNHFTDLHTGILLAFEEYKEEWQKYFNAPVSPRVTGPTDTYSTGCFQVGFYYGRISSGITQRGSFSIQQLPSCCGMVVLQYATEGNDALKELVIKTACLGAKLAGYTYVQYTSIPNLYLDAALSKQGFRPMEKFRSVRTGSDITIWLKNLYEPKPKAQVRKAEEKELVAA